ncbi:hypothetical protein CHLRE_03g187800v5 [Chlamydomonas reinhardtii]|uniref:Uncharacterized protein n=1 Tax=Chlamydomonas reinhardtii TaxID=3055 RepID=A0A2K3DY79_CHLRE|nr:uncharacterized protein CHLRE_03g187800v5 [Chlamydomonas reinhardtii]PNW85467.1 hypothetical protein CHLRE_03g187800v5 [Chlamydomonas reinhardtii]
MLQLSSSRHQVVPAAAARHCLPSPRACARPALRRCVVVRASAAAAEPPPPEQQPNNAAARPAAAAATDEAPAAPDATATARATPATTAALPHQARQLLDTTRGGADESALPAALAASGDEQAAAQLKDLRAGQLSLGSDVDGVKEKLGEVKQELEAVKQELAAMRQAAAEEARFTRLQRARVLVCGGEDSEDEQYNYPADQILAGLICGETEFDLGDGCITGSPHAPGEQCNEFASYMHSLTGWRFRVKRRPWRRFMLLLAEEDK